MLPDYYNYTRIARIVKWIGLVLLAFLFNEIMFAGILLVGWFIAALVWPLPRGAFFSIFRQELKEGVSGSSWYQELSEKYSGGQWMIRAELRRALDAFEEEYGITSRRRSER
jgi:hypothetical protein